MGRRSRDADSLARDFQAAWNRKLYHWWHHYNAEYLDGSLSVPIIRVNQSRQTLGSWTSSTRTLTICFRHIMHDPWRSVMETLRHEMAHQYADELLQAAHERPHGRAFRAACRKLRCPAAATTHSNIAKHHGTSSEQQEDHIARVLQKLLALADSPNEFEAQAALQKARHLLVKHNLSVVESDHQRSFSSRSLGSVKRRHAAYELWLGSLLNRFFFVEVLWQESYNAANNREGTVLEIFGTAHNLDMAAYVHTYLFTVMKDLWKIYRREAAVTSNHERLHYFAGVVEGFHGSLEEQDKGLASTTTLVWKGDPQLGEYYRYMNPRIRTRNTRGVRQTAVFDAGKQAGSNVRIRKPLTTVGHCRHYLPG